MIQPGCKLLFSIFIAQVCWCQQVPGQLTARELFYHEKPDNDKLPPPAQARASAQNTNPPRTAPARKQPPNEVAKNGSGGGAPTQTVAAGAPPVQNLGLRYNVVLVDTRSAKGEPADPDRMFQPKECLALEFESNRSGYLYVFEQASEGHWQPMFPSAELPDESNVVRARTKVRVPAHDCFEVSGAPGVERVYVVLSRKVENFYDLTESVKNPGNDGGRPSPEPNSNLILLTQDRLGAEIERINHEMQGRELKLRKVAKPESPDEPANSVYIVNTSTTPSDRVVSEIHINHR